MDHPEITTRRALEIVLSRVQMNGRSAEDLIWALNNEIKDPADPRIIDPDAVAATLMSIREELRGIDMSFDKKSMISRIQTAKQRIGYLL